MSISLHLRTMFRTISHTISRTPLYQLAICLLVFCNATATIAAEQTLSLAQAQQLAVKRSRQLIGQDNAISAAHEMAVAARQLPDPVLKFGIDNLPVGGADRFSLGNDFMTMRRLGVMQEITRADKLKYRSDQFEIAAQKTLAEKSLNSASIQRDSALAWLDRYFTERQLALIDEQLGQTQQEQQAAQSAYKSGRSSQAEVLAAESAVWMMEDRQIELQTQLRKAKTQLFRWVGSAGDALLAEPPDLSKSALDSADLSQQMTQHPQLNILAKQEQLAKAEASLARASQKPDWSVEVSYQQRGAAYPNMISIGVSLPLQWDQGKRQNRELSAKLAMATQAGAEHEEALRMLVAETQNTLSEWRSKRERLARFQSKLLPLAQQRVAASMAAYRGGKLSLNEFLATQRNETEIRLQTLQLEADAAKLWVNLQFLNVHLTPSPASGMRPE
jgi:outer membrane protein TolC